MYSQSGAVVAGTAVFITLGGVAQFVQYSRKFAGPINEFSNILHEFQSAFSAAERVFAILETPNEINEGRENIDVEKIEGNDKKKEIQKLAGQLSELLHTYNEENGDDEELNKYVKGMIDAQTDGDGEEISDDDMDMEEPEMDDEMDMEEPEMGNDMDMEEPEMGKNKPQPEKKIKESKRFTKKQLMEEFGEISQNNKNREEDKLRLNKKINLQYVKERNPFTPPKFH